MATNSTGLSEKGLRSEFNDIYSVRDQMTVWREVTQIIPSTSDAEKYPVLGGVPPLTPFLSERKGKGIGSESYSVENLKYESTIDVKRDEIDDDQTNSILTRVQELGERAATHKDFLLEGLLNNGDQTGFNSYDGVSFYNDAHISGRSGSNDNNATFDISSVLPDEPDTPNDPSPETIRYMVAEALGQMARFTDDQGQFFRHAQTDIVILCRPENYFQVNRALNAGMMSSQTAGGGGDNTSVFPHQGGRIRALPMPGISSVDFYHILSVGGIVKPFILQDRRPIEFTSLLGDSDAGFNREIYRYGVAARYRLTYGNWAMAFQMQLI